MIVGHCVYHIKPGQRDAFLRDAAEFFEKANQEPGCQYYTPMLSISDENAVCVWECWENEESYAAHFHTPHLKILDKMTEIYLEGMTSDFYNGEMHLDHNYQTAAQLLALQK